MRIDNVTARWIDGFSTSSRRNRLHISLSRILGPQIASMRRTYWIIDEARSYRLRYTYINYFHLTWLVLSPYLLSSCQFTRLGRIAGRKGTSKFLYYVSRERITFHNSFVEEHKDCHAREKVSWQKMNVNTRTATQEKKYHPIRIMQQAILENRYM